jgi:hypothetical protein
MLSHSSPVFKELTGFSCEMVHLSDHADNVGHVLQAPRYCALVITIMGRLTHHTLSSNFSGTEEVPISATSAFLRLGVNYKMYNKPLDEGGCSETVFGLPTWKEL